MSTAKCYRSTLEAVLVQQNAIGFVVRIEYYRRVREVVLVQQSTIRALRRLSWYSRVLKDI